MILEHGLSYTFNRGDDTVADIPGLPEGVEIVRVGELRSADELILGPPIMRGGLIVRIKPGYCTAYNSAECKWEIIKGYDKPKLLSVPVRNPVEEADVRVALAKMGLPAPREIA